MSYAVIAYNSTIHSSTKYTPYELILGHTDSRDPMKLVPGQVFAEYVSTHQTNTKALYEEIHKQSENLKQKIIDKRNQNKKPQNLTIGSQVYKKTQPRSNKLNRKFNGPYILTKILDNSKIEIQNPKTKKTEIIHINETKIMPIVPDGSESSTPPPTE